MTQATHDYSIANDTGSAVRTDLNTLFTEIETANAGTTAPSNTAEGKLWYDTGNNVYKMYDGSAWVAISAKMDAVSASSGGTFTGAVTLPSPVINTGVSGTAILDEDAMGSDSATQLATQQSIKAYVDLKAPVASPTFTGTASFSDGNITNVGDIALDTISSDAGTSIGVTLGTDAGDDFNVGSGKLVVEGDSGNVGIGTASPTSPAGVTRFLHINTDTVSGGAGIVLDAYAGNPFNIYNNAGDLYHWNGAHRFTISAAGTFGGSASADISDERLKENITTIPDALQKIKALTGRTFTWKEEADMQSGTQYGLIAQELEAVIPDLVHNESGIRIFDKDGNLKPDAVELSVGDEWGKHIHMSGCIPILIEAVKELSAKVTALENA
jgi:hypothetical protein